MPSLDQQLKRSNQVLSFSHTFFHSPFLLLAFIVAFYYGRSDKKVVCLAIGSTHRPSLRIWFDCGFSEIKEGENGWIEERMKVSFPFDIKWCWQKNERNAVQRGKEEFLFNSVWHNKIFFYIIVRYCKGPTLPFGRSNKIFFLIFIFQYGTIQRWSQCKKREMEKKQIEQKASCYLVIVVVAVFALACLPMPRNLFVSAPIFALQSHDDLSQPIEIIKLMV